MVSATHLTGRQVSKYRSVNSYLHLTLAWIAEWDIETRARVLLEKVYFLPDEAFEEVTWLRGGGGGSSRPRNAASKASRGAGGAATSSKGSTAASNLFTASSRDSSKSADPADRMERLGGLLPLTSSSTTAKPPEDIWFDFLLSHMDWRGLVAWVQALPLHHAEHSCDAFGRTEYDFSHVRKRLQYLHPYALELLHQAFAKRGVFSLIYDDHVDYEQAGSEEATEEEASRASGSEELFFDEDEDHEAGGEAVGVETGEDFLRGDERSKKMKPGGPGRDFKPLMMRLARSQQLFASLSSSGGAQSPAPAAPSPGQPSPADLHHLLPAPSAEGGGGAASAAPFLQMSEKQKLDGSASTNPTPGPAPRGAPSGGPQSGSQLSLDRLLPKGEYLSPFHNYFVQFCIREELPSVLLLYLQSYNLFSSFRYLDAFLRVKKPDDDEAGMGIKKIKCNYVPPHEQEIRPRLPGRKPWADLLLVGRLGNAHLFTASLQHAALLLENGGEVGPRAPRPLFEAGGAGGEEEAVTSPPSPGAAARQHSSSRNQSRPENEAGGGASSSRRRRTLTRRGANSRDPPTPATTSGAAFVLREDGSQIRYVALRDLPIDTEQECITFLATLMFAPVQSAFQSVKASKSRRRLKKIRRRKEDEEGEQEEAVLPWHCSGGKLLSVCHRFPMLQTALNIVGEDPRFGGMLGGSCSPRTSGGSQAVSGSPNELIEVEVEQQEEEDEGSGRQEVQLAADEPNEKMAEQQSTPPSGGCSSGASGCRSSSSGDSRKQEEDSWSSEEEEEEEEDASSSSDGKGRGTARTATGRRTKATSKNSSTGGQNDRRRVELIREPDEFSVAASVFYENEKRWSRAEEKKRSILEERMRAEAAQREEEAMRDQRARSRGGASQCSGTIFQRSDSNGSATPDAAVAHDGRRGGSVIQRSQGSTALLQHHQPGQGGTQASFLKDSGALKLLPVARLLGKSPDDFYFHQNQEVSSSDDSTWSDTSSSDEGENSTENSDSRELLVVAPFGANSSGAARTSTSVTRSLVTPGNRSKLGGVFGSSGHKKTSRGATMSKGSVISSAGTPSVQSRSSGKKRRNIKRKEAGSTKRMTRMGMLDVVGGEDHAPLLQDEGRGATAFKQLSKGLHHAANSKETTNSNSSATIKSRSKNTDGGSTTSAGEVNENEADQVDSEEDSTTEDLLLSGDGILEQTLDEPPQVSDGRLLQTYQQDVKLLDLLSDVSSFDVGEALKPLPDRIGLLLLPSRPPNHELANCPKNGKGSFKQRFSLGEAYYLAQGRPLMAFHVHQKRLQKVMRRFFHQTNFHRLLKLRRKKEAQRLHRIAKSVALHNLLHEGVVSSAVCLLELCGLDTEMLRVDVQAARRIYDHANSKASRKIACSSVIELFLSFPETNRSLFVTGDNFGGDNVFEDWELAGGRRWDLHQEQAEDEDHDIVLTDEEDEDGAPEMEEARHSASEEEITAEAAAAAAMNCPALLTSLRMLEESTWALDPHPGSSSSSSATQNQLQSQTTQLDSPWHLVALFCRVHALPRSLTLLHELARNGDWVMLLHESDLQECPPDTVLDVVDGYFTDAALQSHLRIVIQTNFMSSSLATVFAGQLQGGHGHQTQKLDSAGSAAATVVATSAAAGAGGTGTPSGVTPTARMPLSKLELSTARVQPIAGGPTTTRTNNYASTAGAGSRGAPASATHSNLSSLFNCTHGALGFFLSMQLVQDEDGVRGAGANQQLWTAIQGTKQQPLTGLPNVGKELLLHAVRTKTPRLAVVASCFFASVGGTSTGEGAAAGAQFSSEDKGGRISWLRCMSVWLSVIYGEPPTEVQQCQLRPGTPGSELATPAHQHQQHASAGFAQQDPFFRGSQANLLRGSSATGNMKSGRYYSGPQQEHGLSSAGTNTNLMNLKTRENSVGPLLLQSVNIRDAPVSWGRVELGRYIGLLIRGKAFTPILRCLKIFDPANPFLHFVRFAQAFSLFRFTAAEKHLRRYVRIAGAARPPQGEQQTKSKVIFDDTWALSEEICEFLLQENFGTRAALLKILRTFSGRYDRSYRAFRLLEKSGLQVEKYHDLVTTQINHAAATVVEANGNHENDVDKNAGDEDELLRLLLAQKLTTEAREWALTGKEGPVRQRALEMILLEEVKEEVVKFQQGVWWTVPAERSALWERVHAKIQHAQKDFRKTEASSGSISSGEDGGSSCSSRGYEVFFSFLIEHEEDLTAEEQLVMLRFLLRGCADWLRVQSTTSFEDPAGGATAPERAEDHAQEPPVEAALYLLKQCADCVRACLCVVAHGQGEGEAALNRCAAVPLRPWLRKAANSLSQAASSNAALNLLKPLLKSGGTGGAGNKDKNQQHHHHHKNHTAHVGAVAATNHKLSLYNEDYYDLHQDISASSRKKNDAASNVIAIYVQRAYQSLKQLPKGELPKSSEVGNTNDEDLQEGGTGKGNSSFCFAIDHDPTREDSKLVAMVFGDLLSESENEIPPEMMNESERRSPKLSPSNSKEVVEVDDEKQPSGGGAGAEVDRDHLRPRVVKNGGNSYYNGAAEDVDEILVRKTLQDFFARAMQKMQSEELNALSIEIEGRWVDKNQDDFLNYVAFLNASPAAAGRSGSAAASSETVGLLGDVAMQIVLNRTRAKIIKQQDCREGRTILEARSTTSTSSSSGPRGRLVGEFGQRLERMVCRYDVDAPSSVSVSVDGKREAAMECRLLILAYHCFVRACSQRGISRVLRIIRAISEKVFFLADRPGASDGDHHLPQAHLLNLVAEILFQLPEYRQLRPHLFRCFTRTSSDALEGFVNRLAVAGPDVEALRVAFVRFLQDECLVQKRLAFDSLAQALARLGLKSQLAELLLQRGVGMLERFGGVPTSNPQLEVWRDVVCTEEGEERLLLILSLFTQAGKYFGEAERYVKHAECVRLACLVAVQLKAIQVHLAFSCTAAPSLEEQISSDRDMILAHLEAKRKAGSKGGGSEDVRAAGGGISNREQAAQRTPENSSRTERERKRGNSEEGGEEEVATSRSADPSPQNMTVPRASSGDLIKGAAGSTPDLLFQSVQVVEDEEEQLQMVRQQARQTGNMTNKLGTSTCAASPNDFELGRTPWAQLEVLEDESYAAPATSMLSKPNEGGNTTSKPKSSMGRAARRSSSDFDDIFAPSPTARKAARAIDFESHTTRTADEVVLTDRKSSSLRFLEKATNERDDDHTAGVCISTRDGDKRNGDALNPETAAPSGGFSLRQDTGWLASATASKTKRRLSDELDELLAPRTKRVDKINAGVHNSPATTCTTEQVKKRNQQEDHSARGTTTSTTGTGTSASCSSFGPSSLSPDLGVQVDDPEKQAASGLLVVQDKNPNPKMSFLSCTIQKEGAHLASPQSSPDDIDSQSANGGELQHQGTAGTESGGGAMVRGSTSSRSLLQKLHDLRAEANKAEAPATKKTLETTRGEQLQQRTCSEQDVLRPLPDADPFLVVNLTEKEVRTFAEYHCDFLCANIVVQAQESLRCGGRSRALISGTAKRHSSSPSGREPTEEVKSTSKKSRVRTPTSTSSARGPQKQNENEQIDTAALWGRCLFRQVIVNRNLNYLALFLEQREVSEEIVRVALNAFKEHLLEMQGGPESTSNTSKSAAVNVTRSKKEKRKPSVGVLGEREALEGARLFLRAAVTNLEDRLRYAKELQLSDVVEEIKERINPQPHFRKYLPRMGRGVVSCHRSLAL